MMKGLAAVGDVLAGKYRVDKILGIGGMGMVVAATHLELEQRVALKFMLPGSSESADSSARFLREARAAGRLNSEHVCRVMDVGRFETGTPYIVMEYLQGENLASVLRRRGPMRVSEAVDYILQGIEGLAEAHAHGIIHRDLKPDNLFLHKRNDGGTIVKVLDFGISKLKVAGASTRTGDIMGSPAYMAPEQMESSRSVDHRADVWSLGVVLYQLVVGKAPFQGDTLPLLCLHVVNDEPPAMSTVRGDLPDGFEAVVMKCLHKEPEGRYADVGELAEALAPFGPKHATTSASRIQIVLRRSTKDSSTVIVNEIAYVAPAVAPPIAPVEAAPAAARDALQSTTLGHTSGQSLATLRTERSSRMLVIGLLAALGLVAAAIGAVWPSRHDVATGRAPGAVAPDRPRPIVEPIIEPAPAAAAPSVAPGPVEPAPRAAEPSMPPTEPAPSPAIEAPVAAAPAVRTQGPARPDRKSRKNRRPGAGSAAASGSGSAAPAAGSASEEDDKWMHMTHDDKPREEAPP